MEKRCVIALIAQNAPQSLQFVERSRGEEKRLYKSWNPRQHRWKSVDALLPIGKRVVKDQALLDEAIEKRRVAAVFPAVEVLVERADILLAETLQHEHHHILAIRLDAVAGEVERGVNGGETLLIGEVRGGYKRLLPDSAEHREGGVEHDSRLNRLINVGVGIANGDGAHIATDTAAHTKHDERRHDSENESAHDVVCHLVASPFRLRDAVKTEHRPAEEDGKQHQIPVGESFLRNNRAEVALVGELAEHRHSGASPRESEIHRVDEVDSHIEHIHHHKQPSERVVIAAVFLDVARKQDKQKVKSVAVEQSRGVEHQSAACHLQEMR